MSGILLLMAAAVGAPALPRAPEGFVVEMAVAPPGGPDRGPDGGSPATVFPMFAAFDDDGRLFVAESSGLDLYAELAAQTRKCRIRLFEDRDGDGRFEVARVFADRLVFPMGLAWLNGRLYAADPPDLVAFTDVDGDGSADRREVILSGFGHIDNGSLHGLAFGPDGFLYMTMGDPDGYRLPLGDGRFLEGETGALLRCRPDGTRPEALSSGFTNLVEVEFLPTGEIVGTDNWFQLPEGGLRDSLVHLVDGGIYPLNHGRRHPLPSTGEPLPSINLLPAVALSGLVVLRGPSFPPEMRGNLFTAQHNARKVGRHVLERSASTFRSRDLDFLLSDDPDFHPSDVLETAEGDLLVVDTGGWYVKHCPTGRIRPSRASGGIYRVRWSGSERIEDAWGRRILWRTAPPADIVSLLADRRPAVRERALREVSTRGSAALGPLARFAAETKDSEPRVLSLWAIGRAGGIGRIPDAGALAALIRALSESDPVTAAAAARVLARFEPGDEIRAAAGPLVRLLERPEPHLRLAAVEALARSGARDSVPAVLRLLDERPDPFIESAAVVALHRLARREDLESALASERPGRRRAALILLDQPPWGELAASQVAGCLRSSDEPLRRAALKVLKRHPEWSSQAAEAFAEGLARPSLTADELFGLRELLAAFAGDSGFAETAGRFLVARGADRARGAGGASSERTLFILDALIQNRPERVPASWLEAVAALIESPETALRAEGVRAAAAFDATPRFEARLRRLAQDPAEPPTVRIAALRAVADRLDATSADVFTFLTGLIKPGRDSLDRLRAAECLAALPLSPAQLIEVLAKASADPMVSPSLFLPRAERLIDAENAPRIVSLLEEAAAAGWRPREGEIARMAGQVAGGEKLTARLASLVREARMEEVARIEKLEPRLLGGDPARGRTVFESQKAGCSACHRAGSQAAAQGGIVGPDLSRIGAARSGRDLLESVVFPSSTFAQGYESYLAITKTGAMHAGTRAGETESTVVLRTSSGAEVPLRRGELRSFERQSVSLMPEGLDRVMTQEELRDLLAFLVELR